MDEKKNITPNLPEKKSSNTIFIVVIALLIVIIGYLVWQINTLTDDKDALIEQVGDIKIEKQNVKHELDDLLVDFKSLETSNDTLNKKLIEKREEIETMLKELKKVKSNSAWQIKKYKDQIKTLKSIMRDFVVQIDSLNQKNQSLTIENTQVKEKYRTATNKNNKLSEANKTLNSQINIASIIKAKNIVATPINRRSKSVKKAKKVTKIKVCFTMLENDIVEAGERTVYVRVSRPDGLVLADSEDNLFEFGEDKIVYTAKRDIQYDNKDVNTCIFWPNNQALVSGKYTVNIFIEGNQVGTSSFLLK